MVIGEKINLLKVTAYLMLLNNPSQGSSVLMEFLEAFTAAHDRHSTAIISEENSGTYKNYKCQPLYLTLARCYDTFL